MVLVPEQIYNLREEKRKVNLKLKHDAEYIHTYRDDIGKMYRDERHDYLFEHEHAKNILKAKEIDKILSDGFYLMKRDFNKVNVGTKVEITLEDGEVESFMLVEELIGVSHNEGFISMNSPIGAAIIGKKEGERFNIKVNGNLVNGIISKIEKDPKTYMHFIKSKPHYDRKSKDYIARLRYLKNNMNSSQEAKKEYDEHLFLTASQKRIIRNGKDKIIKVTEKRLFY